MKNRYMIIAALLAGAAIMTGTGCHSNRDNPKDLLNTFFQAAIRQDYASVYPCYYDAYKAKVSEDDYIRHRKDASVLRSYTVKSITADGDTAHAQVELTFAPSKKLKRDRPFSTAVTEEMVRENGEWKIKVW
jgi:hypothetical protein